MTKEQLALVLNGRQYRDEMTADEEKLAKENGLVVCFGASDDLTEFRGCLYDEKGNYEGGTVYFCKGEIANPDHEDTDEAGIESFEKKEFPKIEALWCPKTRTEKFLHRGLSKLKYLTPLLTFSRTANCTAGVLFLIILSFRRTDAPTTGATHSAALRGRGVMRI